MVSLHKLTKGLLRRPALADAAQSEGSSGSDNTSAQTTGPQAGSEPTTGSQLEPEQTDKPETETTDYGLFRLEPKGETPKTPPEGNYLVDIIAIHGINGNYLSTWRDKETNCIWLQDLLPSSLPGCRVFSYGYPATVFLSSSTAKVGECARLLLSRIRDMLQNKAQANRPIIFVCHSMGGIVFKQALIIAHEEDHSYPLILESIIGVIFMGTPHGGSAWANLANFAANVTNSFTTVMTASWGPKIVKTDMVKLLRNHFQELHDQSVSSRQRLRDIQIVTFYETKTLPYFRSLIVSKESAVLGITGEVVEPTFDTHKSICRFPRKTQSYNTVAQAIERIASPYFQNKTPIQRSSTHSSIGIFNVDDEACFNILNKNNATENSTTPQNPILGTCRWIKDHDIFSLWLAKAENSLLWLTGHPGSGKTIISWSLFNYFQAQSKAGGAIIFFCQNQNKQTDARAVVIGWIIQIISRHGSMLRHVRRTYDKSKSAMIDSFKSLWIIFQRMLNDPKIGILYIFLDSLDECDKASRLVLLHSIFEFQDNSHRTRAGGSRVKFLVTSRPFFLESEANYLKARPLQISIDKNETGYVEDLQVYIREQVDKFSNTRRLPLHLKNFLYDTLTSRADRSFLWIRFVLQTLKDSALSSKKDLAKIMTSIPEGLAKIYDYFLLSIPLEHHEYASFLLQLILASSRPLSLDEINIAFTMRTDYSTVADIMGNLQEGIVDTLQRTLDPLIRISAHERTKQQVVSLIHLSVKEYLLDSTEDDASNSLRMRVARDVSLPLARACIRYLLLADFNTDLFSSAKLVESPIEDLDDDTSGQDDTYLHPDVLFGEPESLYRITYESMQKSYAFYAYAALHWTEHLSDCELSELDELKDMAKHLLDFNTSHCRNWLRYYCTAAPDYLEDNPLDQESIILASQFNLIVVLKDLLDSCEYSQQAKNRSLYWACRHGHEDIVVELLEAGGDPNSKEIDRQTPLAAAAEHGHSCCVVKLLADPRINPNSPGRDSRVPLSFACGNGHAAIVETLLGYQGCDPDIPDFSGATSLFWAAGGEHESIITMLIKSKRSNINHQDNSGRTVVSWLAGDGTADVLRNILKIKGIDFNLEDHLGRSPLSWAAGNGQAATAEVLLRNKAVNKNSFDSNNRGPISWACGGGHSEVLAELLRQGCPGINTKDVDGWAPLAWAVQNDSPETIKILIMNEVQIWGPDDSQRSALQWAVVYGHRKVVEELLNAGAARDKSVANLIDYAKRLQRHDIADDILNYSIRNSL